MRVPRVRAMFMRVMVRFVVRIGEHLLHYKPLLYSRRVLLAVIQQPLLRTLTPRRGESIDALSRR